MSTRGKTITIQITDEWHQVTETKCLPYTRVHEMGTTVIEMLRKLEQNAAFKKQQAIDNIEKTVSLLFGEDKAQAVKTVLGS